MNYELLLRAQSAAMHDATIAASDRNSVMDNKHVKVRKAANTSSIHMVKNRPNIARNTALVSSAFNHNDSQGRQSS